MLHANFSLNNVGSSQEMLWAIPKGLAPKHLVALNCAPGGSVRATHCDTCSGMTLQWLSGTTEHLAQYTVDECICIIVHEQQHMIVTPVFRACRSSLASCMAAQK